MILWYNCIKNNDQGSAFYEKILSTCVTGALLALSLTFSVSAYSDPANGDWSQKSVILKNTSEAELVVLVELFSARRAVIELPAV